MIKLTNTKKIPLSAAVWLAANTYDFKPNAKALSATDFNKSIRQIVLRNRIALLDPTANVELVDIHSSVKSKLGTAVHDAIERTWLDDNLRKAGLKNLGYPQHVQDNIVVNPETVLPNQIPVYMEIRKSIEVDGYTISGKFDFAAEGKLSDFKTTGVWKWNKLDKADVDYRTQGSIYRLIHKDILNKDVLEIVFLFTDWSEGQAKKNPKYPQAQILPHQVMLMSEEETLGFIKDFIRDIEKYKDVAEELLPECNPHQLWQDEPTYKYYKDPAKTVRATANFDTAYEAQTRFIKDGAIGVVKTVFGEAKACKYCPAFNHCTQKDRLIAAGILKLD